MADDERVGLDDYWDVAEDWTSGRDEFSSNGRISDELRTRASASRWAEFGAVEEVASEALLGSRAETILSADGIVLMYGDGGAGKTTLTIDALAHLAEGREWLGLEVERPVGSLIIENEGPRAKFRQTIEQKRATLNGDAGDRLFVLEEPWSRFTLADAGLRSDVAAYVNDNALDVIALGPLATVGMVGGGTPDEISAFEKLLLELRSLIERPVAFWIVHHENKSGDVSGAWERVPDTLVHVQAAGNGHTRFVFRKARWSSEYHGRTLNLAWSEGRTFDVVEDHGRDYYAEVLAVFEADDRWRIVEEIREASGVGTTSLRSVLAELVRRGDLLFEKGPAGRHATANCYRLKGGAVLRLVPDAPEAPSPAPPDGFEF